MPIYYKTSTGERITDNLIKARLSKAYKARYQEEGHPSCEGCGKPAEGSAHIIAKARLKTLHLSDKIYDPDFYFPACHQCNRAIENPSGSDWKKLFNIEKCLELIEKWNKELFSKFV